MSTFVFIVLVCLVLYWLGCGKGRSEVVKTVITGGLIPGDDSPVANLSAWLKSKKTERQIKRSMEGAGVSDEDKAEFTEVFKNLVDEAKAQVKAAKKAAKDAKKDKQA